jgi:hypothetical protein
MSNFPLPQSAPIVDKNGVPTGYFYRYLFQGLFSGKIVTAKLTPGGTNGSMTFSNGRVTAQVAAT